MPTVIDLFAGAGGLSLGTSRAGFTVGAAVDIDKHAMMTHRINFPNTVHMQEDITNLTGTEIL
ncbi:MAG: DNA cytosine methyltransferase, partial [Ruminococcus sp.]|nr:DNA cytosine methyltransferase [Ruminococcus sp.]